MTSLQVIVGAQFGSEGKGAVAARLIRDRLGAVAVRVAGPNAGHTVIGADGTAWALRSIPVAAVANPDALLFIAPGSEIDPDVLFDEVERLDQAGYAVSERLFVSYEATVIEPEHKEMEASGMLTSRLGSTGKGIGAARAERLMRRAKRWGDFVHSDLLRVLRHPAALYGSADLIQIEGTQGYGLGLHAGFYPHCTSSNTRAIDFIAMAQVPVDLLWRQRGGGNREIWLVMRPNPIRVAGNSGPLAGETSWEQLGLPEEYTTVTRKVRRVGEWDLPLVAAAKEANVGRSLALGALTMADHIAPELSNQSGYIEMADLPPRLRQMVTELAGVGVQTRLLGTSPNTMLQIGGSW